MFWLGMFVPVATVCGGRDIVHAVVVGGGVKVIGVGTARVEVRVRVVRMGM